MLIKRPRGWELPESQATDESVFLQRRQLVKAMGFGSIMVAAAPFLSACDEASSSQGENQAAEAGDIQLAAVGESDPSAHLYPVSRNLRYKLDRDLTEEALATTYNNFYEFGSSKTIWRQAQALPLRPWRLSITGDVEEPFEIAVDDLLAKMPLEERLYRHRCVEAWSMAVPWSGFPLAELVKLAKPLSSAKYLKMQTLADSDRMPGVRASWYPWPYTEGLTIEEATNELAFIATGVYGKPLPKQMGAPLRLAAPWKYGFKSIKSIVSIEFTSKRPVSFWEEILGEEYGFWANVNPEVPHRRWSQAEEKVLGTNLEVPTLLYNGYGEYVADLYSGMEGEKLFM